MRRIRHTHGARACIVALLCLAMLAAGPAAAAAWCNGPTKNGQAGAGYGSHDWVLDQAIRHAGAAGTWVKRTTALLATDDPDTAKWAPATQHFYETGSARGGPQTVADLYHKAVVAYRKGDTAAASRYLGQLSHCYADVLQPFHSASLADSYRTLHTQYEYAVDDHQCTPTVSRSWLTLRPTALVANVLTKTIDAALLARSQFPSLLASYKATHSVTSGTPLKVTKLVMSRAVNDLADIIRSIPAAAGEAPVPASVDVALTRTNPHPGTKVGAVVRCSDAAGRPMDGVGVTFVWHAPGGDVTYRTYTCADGAITHYEPVTTAEVGQPITVSVSVTTNGVRTTVDRVFTATAR